METNGKFWKVYAKGEICALRVCYLITPSFLSILHFLKMLSENCILKYVLFWLALYWTLFSSHCRLAFSALKRCNVPLTVQGYNIPLIVPSYPAVIGIFHVFTTVDLAS